MRKFDALKSELKKQGYYPTPYLAEVMEVSYSSLSQKMAGNMEWRLEDVYRLMELIGKPLSEVYKYFPPEDVGEDLNPQLKDGHAEAVMQRKEDTLRNVLGYLIQATSEIKEVNAG